MFIDYVNWGSFKNTYYQFYFHNLSAGVYGRMKDFGVNPWYYYFIEIIKQLAPPSSIFYLLGLVIYWYKNPKNQENRMALKNEGTLIPSVLRN